MGTTPPHKLADVEIEQRLAPIANAMDHHTDVQLHRYRRVKILLTTHSAGGITPNDFELAGQIDDLNP